MLFSNNEGPVLLSSRPASQQQCRRSNKSKSTDRNSWSFQPPPGSSSPATSSNTNREPQLPQTQVNRYSSRHEVWIQREVWEPNRVSPAKTEAPSTASQVRNRSRQRSPGPGTGGHKDKPNREPSLKLTPSSKGIDYIRSPSNLSVNAITATRRTLALTRSCESSSSTTCLNPSPTSANNPEEAKEHTQEREKGKNFVYAQSASVQDQPSLGYYPSLKSALTPSQSILHDPFFKDYQDVHDLSLPVDRNLFGNPDGASTASPASTTEREFSSTLALTPGHPSGPAAGDQRHSHNAAYPDVLRNTKVVDEYKLLHISERDRKPTGVAKTERGGEEAKYFNQASPEDFKDEESSLVCKGLLWVMRDRLFSRWRERYCLLTKDYLHCFKHSSGLSLTPMGAFLFKVNLADVTESEWMEKKGQVAIALTLPREGKLLLKCTNGLSDWFTALKSCIQDSKGRRHTLLGRKMEPEMQNRLKQRLKTNLQHTVSAESAPDVSRPPPRSQSQASQSKSHGNSRPPSRYRFSMLAEIDICSPSSMPNVQRPEAGAIQKQVTKTGKNAGVSSRPHCIASTPSSHIRTVPELGTDAEQQMPNAGEVQAVRYRERSSSVDRTRMSRRSAEMTAQRRSYYLSPVTQV